MIIKTYRNHLISVIFILLLSMTMTGCATVGGALINASSEGQTTVVKDLLEKGADVNERGLCGGWDTGGDKGVTPLFCAAHGGHMEAVKILISKGADVNVKGSGILAFGRTPLTAAVYARHTGIAKLLIENGADVDYAMAILKKQGLKDQYEFLERLVNKYQPPRYGASPPTLPTALPLPTEPAAPF